MHQNKWFKVITLGTLLWSLAFASGIGIAGATTGPERHATFASCAQLVREDLGTVMPSTWPSSLQAQCPRSEAPRHVSSTTSLGVAFAAPGGSACSIDVSQLSPMTGTYLPSFSGSNTTQFAPMTGTYLPSFSGSNTTQFAPMTGTYLPSFSGSGC